VLVGGEQVAQNRIAKYVRYAQFRTGVRHAFITCRLGSGADSICPTLCVRFAAGANVRVGGLGAVGLGAGDALAQPLSAHYRR
jgi:hypothetical protein